MPKKNTHTGAAQGSRKDPKRRAAGQRSVRRQGAGKTPAPASAGNTLSSIKFAPKPGTEVFFRLEGIPEEGGGEKLYDDLFRVYRNAHYRITGQRIKTNPASYLSLSHALDYVLSSFKKLLPAGFDFNIELEDGGGDYYFVVFKRGDPMWGWSFFPIERALKKLSIESPALHELFLIFLRALHKKAGVELITNGLMGNTLEFLKDTFSELKAENDTEYTIDLAKDIHTYTKGEAYRYEALIQSYPDEAPAKIMQRASRFKKCAPIADLIYQGCHLLLEGNNLFDFTYFPVPPYEGYDIGLSLDCQFSIIWNEADSLKHEHDSSLDSYANEGTQEPVVFLKIYAITKEINLERLSQKLSWPQQLADFFGRAYDLIHKYTDNE